MTSLVDRVSNIINNRYFHDPGYIPELDEIANVIAALRGLVDQYGGAYSTDDDAAMKTARAALTLAEG